MRIDPTLYTIGPAYPVTFTPHDVAIVWREPKRTYRGRHKMRAWRLWRARSVEVFNLGTSATLNSTGMYATPTGGHVDADDGA